ncbi:MAG: hypothetical protein U0736_11280 [Gemmataceae bacterium]
MTIDGPLFTGVDVVRLGKPPARAVAYGLPKDRFGARDGVKAVDDASLVLPTRALTGVRLPAALLAGREFVVDVRLTDSPGNRVVRVGVSTRHDATLNAGAPVLAAPGSAGYRRLLDGYADFRRVFPLYLCFPPVVPTDEVVSLKMFHREDEPFARLFLTSDEVRQLDRLWAEHRFVSRQPVAENNYLPQFMGFTTQDTPRRCSSSSSIASRCSSATPTSSSRRRKRRSHGSSTPCWRSPNERTAGRCCRRRKTIC